MNIAKHKQYRKEKRIFPMAIKAPSAADIF